MRWSATRCEKRIFSRKGIKEIVFFFKLLNVWYARWLCTGFGFVVRGSWIVQISNGILVNHYVLLCSTCVPIWWIDHELMCKLSVYRRKMSIQKICILYCVPSLVCWIVLWRGVGAFRCHMQTETMIVPYILCKFWTQIRYYYYFIVGIIIIKYV